MIYPSRVQDAVDRHDEALAEFRIVLVAKQVGSSRTRLCEDPQLLRLVAKCADQHMAATNAYDEIQSRLSSEGGEVSMEDQRALDRASRLIGRMEPITASSFELAKAGTCDPYRIAINVIEQNTEDEKARKIESSQERADFLDELANEAIRDKRVAPASGSNSEPVKPSSGWDHSRFVDLYSRYLAASTEYKRAAKGFLDRLDVLSAYGEEICHDHVLAYSYSEVRRTSEILGSLIEEIFAMAHPSTTAFKSYNAAISNPDESFYRLPVEDQLAFAEFARDYQNLMIVSDFIGSELSAKAEGCDPEELADQGNRTAEEGQDPESGLDAGADVVEGGGPTGPTANFTASPTSGDAPLVVHFTDRSSGGEIDSWHWSFGDGGSSTAQHPSYTFEDEGNWTVSLTVSGPDGSDTETKSGYISVGGSGGDLRYVRTGDPWIQEKTRADCDGGYFETYQGICFIP